MYDSEKSSIAITVFREVRPESVFEFASSIQKAFFYDGLDVNQDNTFLSLIKPYQIDEKEFMRRLHSDEYKKKTYHEFRQAAYYNLAYPSCLLVTERGSEMVSIGYEKAERLIKKIESKLALTNSPIHV